MLNLKDFPIYIKDGIIFNKDDKIILDFRNSSTENEEEFLKILCVCANYGKRALLQKKMKSFDLPLKDAEDAAITEMYIQNLFLCNQSEVELEYTVISFDAKHILKPKEKKVLYFKTKTNN